MADPNLRENWIELTRSEPHEEFIDFESGDVESTIVYRGPWEDRFNFVFDYLLTPASDRTFVIPRVHPEIPIIFAHDMTITGAGESGDVGTGGERWTHARVAVRYIKPVYNLARADISNTSERNYVNGVFVEESGDSHVEGLITGDENNKFKDEVTGDIVDGLFDKTIPLMDLTITEHYKIFPPFDAMDLLKGKVNNICFIAPSGRYFHRETLRYDGYTYDTKVNINTRAGEDFPVPVYTIHHRFVYNRNGWNKKLHKGVFTPIVHKDTSKKPFESDDLYYAFFGAKTITEILTTTRESIDSQIDIINVWLAAGRDLLDPNIQTALSTIVDLLRSLGFRV